MHYLFINHHSSLSHPLLPILRRVGRRTHAGGWKPIPVVNHPEVVRIGRFAVHEHNKEAHASLKFGKLVKGETQVVAGMKYNLMIKATDGSAEKTYVALVWDKPWKKFRQLFSFIGPV